MPYEPKCPRRKKCRHYFHPSVLEGDKKSREHHPCLFWKNGACRNARALAEMKKNYPLAKKGARREK
ncbi:MAG: hypothetical protein ABIH38_05390 [Patescibacteria group bacterium]